ncbi:MAG: hypothetical protein Q8N18_10120 [Opitutaceae bacterium]|nr:hypothetical protein [Opitutaceae bacterium]
MNPQRRIYVCALLMFSGVARAERYSILVPDIPRPVTIAFPDGFTPPDSTAARERRESFLEFYRQNPAMKGKYCEVLLRDWKNAKRLPQIVIGVLGSTEKNQGKITPSDWSKLRALFLKASATEVTKIRDRMRPEIEAGSPITNRTHQELIWLEDQKEMNSVIVMAQMRSQLGDDRDDVFSARKIIYHKGYLVFANVVVDSSKPDALSEIRSYLSAIKVESI